MSAPTQTPPTNTEPTTNPTPTPAASGGAPEKTFTQAELEAVIADRLGRQQRAIEAKSAKDKEAADAAKLAEQGEYKKLADAATLRASTLEAALAARDHADLQRVVAAEHKLPDALANRLTGTTREELAADAKKLAELVATPAAPPTPGNRPNPRPTANAPGGQSTEDLLRAGGSYNAL